jgi:hypothetical protein
MFRPNDEYRMGKKSGVKRTVDTSQSTNVPERYSIEPLLVAWPVCLTFRALEISTIALVRPKEVCAVCSLDLTLDPSLHDPRVSLANENGRLSICQFTPRTIYHTGIAFHPCFDRLDHET